MYTKNCVALIILNQAPLLNASEVALKLKSWYTNGTLMVHNMTGTIPTTALMELKFLNLFFIEPKLTLFCI
jgi:hypothetical protein